MTILFGPDGLVKDEDKVAQHKWDAYQAHCELCKIARSYYEDTGTPCTTDIMPE